MRRVELTPLTPEDAQEFIGLMHASRAFHRPWSAPPSDLDAYDVYMERASSDDFEALGVRRVEDGALVGYMELSQIVRGRFQSAYLGYNAGAVHAGQGFMREGMELLLRHAFEELRLHRVEANIQPENAASVALARGAGFRREGFSPRYLKIGGRWRDHERWAILAEEWKLRRA
jgi:[ribosomal protein S5]-alanine N-acetyltransferase